MPTVSAYFDVQATPPGFISPAALPFSQPPLLPNNVPLPQPYPNGSSTSNTANTFITIPVQGQTNRGDAIVVVVYYASTFGTSISATDTQGNVYGLAAAQRTLQPLCSVYIAQNTIPLTRADSVTVTFSTSASQFREAFITRVSNSLVSTNPGSAWVTYNNTGIGNTNTGTISFTASGVISGFGIILSTVASSSGTVGYPLYPQGWVVIQSGNGHGSTYGAVVAFTNLTTAIASGAAVVRVQNPSVGTNITGAYVVLQLETRFAPNKPFPDMPPGMQSPGAWQFTPLASIGPSGFNQNWARNFPQQLPASPHAATVTARGVSKLTSASATTTVPVVKITGKITSAAAHFSGNTQRSTGKIALAVTHFSGSIERAISKFTSAVTHFSSSAQRVTSKHVTAVVVSSAQTIGRFTITLLTRAYSAARLIIPQRVTILSVIAARLRWRNDSGQLKWRSGNGRLKWRNDSSRNE